MPENITRPRSPEVSLLMVKRLQSVALRGWQAALPHRSEAELRYQFDPDNLSHLRRVQKIYQSHACVGGLVLMYPAQGCAPIGFALAREDVSGRPPEQLHKRTFQPKKVYAWMRHVCIEPEYQHRGLGRQLITAALEPFKPEQIPAAYIFDENAGALKTFASLGFLKSPLDQEPKIDAAYFGDRNAPAVQFRFAAPSVAGVIAIARS